MPHSENIRNYIIRHIGMGSKDLIQGASDKFGISRQAVHKHLKQLIEEGLIGAKGNTRNKEYSLVMLCNKVFEFNLNRDLEEDVVWRKNIRSLMEGLQKNVLHICEYGFTEMLNNAIDHSEGRKCVVSVMRNAAMVVMSVADDGVGIFNKIKRVLNLDDERHAILELTKGKLTTDPSRHSGEGIFFTSRMFDQFTILSDNLSFMHMPDDRDWLIENSDQPVKGTTFIMIISSFSGRTVKEVFDRYASDKEDYGFDKTYVPVFLAKYGDENLVSRSQAKRLLARVDRFKEVVFDFNGVSMIGQAFADEIFRVFQNQNPDIHLNWTNANEDVERMIRRSSRIQEDNSPYKQLSLFDDL